MASSFNINQADLAFILKQIKIAEATSEAYTPAVTPVSILQAIMDAYGLSAADAAIAPFGLRTVDGTFNNLMPGQSGFGAADTLFPRLTDPQYLNEQDETPFVGVTNTNYGQGGNVVDSDPRTISNLIVDMSVNNPAAIEAFLNNPLAVAAFEETHPDVSDIRAWLTDPVNVNAANEALQTIQTQSPDVGLSPGFNSWMTIFGQFFDHGLDLVTKGGNGTVYIPLQPDDPLIAGADGILNDDPNTTVNEAADNLPPHLRFMALTRATPTVVNGVAQHENTTTSFIDQNQTYTSHSSHQVFLREYTTVDGKTVSTGKLLDGTTASGSADGAVGNWAEVKAQALQYLGIKLSDFDVHNVPLLRTDAYGKFIPDPTTGYAQVIVSAGVDGILNTADDVVVSGTPAAPVDLSTTAVQRTGHAFLNDIAHHAAPSFVDFNRDGILNGPDYLQVADANVDRNGDGLYNLADLDVDGDLNVTNAEIASLVADVNRDGVVNLADVDRNNDGFLTDVDFDIDGNGVVNKADLVADDRNGNTYDNEMLDAHFVTGDGRGNENIALTAVHSVFHSEHNRTVEANKETILAANDLAFLNEWLLVDVNAIPTDPAEIANLKWDGDRLFQAARFTTEMQYQHLVFEEFARRIQPAIEPFVFNNSPDIDPSILAEFAHTVYRFGHSMLTGTVDRLDNNLELLNGDTSQQTLLAMFLNPQAYVTSGATVEEINANLIRGLSRDVGNAIDEFIVTDLRSNLLGLPLDLAALNIARGRDTGIPSLNETRRQLFMATNGLADLDPYDSWADFAQNLKNASSVINFIAAYGTHSTIINATTLADKRAAAEAIVFGGAGAPADRLDFLNATGAYAGGSLGGLNNVDLWIGGLAEKSPEFGGMLGTTFNYVFEAQMESLEAGDRLYYLSRTQGTNLLNQLEPNTFSDLVMRNTALGDKYATHLYGSLFVTPDLILELDRGIAQTDYNGAAAGKDPLWNNPILGDKVIRNYNVPGHQIVDGNHDFGGYLKVQGGEHSVLGGTEGNDTLLGDGGDDALWGDGGNDFLNGGDAADNVFGGEGDDIIVDPFGDDVLRGNQGNDVITSARGVDLLFGDQGTDYIVLGQDASEVFAGQGDDFILGGSGADALLGNEGNDWIEGGAGFDGISGDNSELFFNSPIIGHDVLFGHGEETDYDAESGDDIMSSAGGTVNRYEGMFGFDWGIAKNDTTNVTFDLTPIPIATIPANVLRDRFDQVEAASGWKNDDRLNGDDRGNANVDPALSFDDHVLTAEGIARIDGMQAWLGNALTTLGTGTSFRDGNILLGGDGNDFIQGRGGFDLIDGDAWLNVRIKIDINGTIYSAESMSTDKAVAGPYAGKVFNVDANGNPDFTSPAFGGATLTSLLLNRTINPGQMSIVREIKSDDTNLTGPNKNIDTAIYRGNFADYEIEGLNQIGQATDVNGDGFISVSDLRNVAAGDDTDLLKNIEQLQFADRTFRLDATLPSDIQWNAVTPVNANALPGAGAVIANLSTTDSDTTTGFTYSLAAGSAANFAVSSTGVVTRTNLAMAQNTIYLLNISSTDTTGATRTETFTIRTGSNAINVLNGNATDNIMYGLDGNDNLNGAGGNDNLFGQAGNDNLNGGDGNDILLGGSGNDNLNGGAGNDTLLGGVGNDNVIGDTGNDTIRHTVGDSIDFVDGGADSDRLEITSNGGNQSLAVTYNGTSLTNFDSGIVTNVESVTADLGGGTDTLTYTAPGGVTVNLAAGTASGFTSIANIENVTTNGGSDTVTGSSVANVLSGGGAADLLSGGGGDDSLIGGNGNDSLNGDADNDTLVGGGGVDILTGGAGNDIFDFNQLAEMGVGIDNRDIVTDFLGGGGADIIDLSTLDANSVAGGNQTFTLTTGGGSGAFTARGQLRFTLDGLGNTVIQGNSTGGLATDFEILLQGYTGAIGSGNFVL